MVDVEVRGAGTEAFGKGRKRKGTFEEVLRAAQQGDDSLYMTTQRAEMEADGYPAVLAPPLTALQRDLPLVPALLGNLVPQTVNVWMGCAPTGASSGLHHDFHDNLYVLLRGRKRFRLWPPTQAARMCTHGKLQRIHPNGRIVYEGQVCHSALTCPHRLCSCIESPSIGCYQPAT